MNLTIKILLISVLLQTSAFLQILSQERSKTDELIWKLNHAENDSQKVDLLLKIGLEYEKKYSDSAHVYYLQAYDVADKYQTRLENENNAGRLIAMLLKSNALHNIGIYYHYAGNYEKARYNYGQSIALFKKVFSDNGSDSVVKREATLGLSYNYTNMGVLCRYSGENHEAIEYYTMAAGILSDMKNEKGVSACYNNLGTIYAEQGNYEKAIEYYERSLKIKQTINDTRGMSQCYSNLGVAYRSLNNNQMALDFFRRSLDIDREAKDDRGIATGTSNIGNIYYIGQQPGVALKYYTEALETRKRLKDKKGLANSYSAVSITYLSIADSLKNSDPERKQQYLSLAGEYLDKSDSLNAELEILPLTRLIYLYYANLNIALKNELKAEENFRKLIEANNKSIGVNFSFISEKEKELFFKTVAADYDYFYSFALSRIKNNPAIAGDVYNSIIKNKGLLLKSSTALRTAIQNSNDSLLLGKYEKWALLKKDISNLYSAGPGKRQQEIKDLEEQADSLERILASGSSVFSDFEKMQAVTWQDIRDNLKNGEAAMEIIAFKYLGDNFSYSTDTVMYCALIIKPGCPYPDMIRLCTESDLKRIIGTLQNRNNLPRILYGSRKEGNTALYKLIWQPVEKNLEGIKIIYFSPAGLLHKISIPAITKEKNVILCDHYEIYNQTSTAKVVLIENRLMEGSITATLFGGMNYNRDSNSVELWKYLEGSLVETQNIRSLFEKSKVSVNFFSGNESSEDKFKLLASESNILHIATHGFFYPEPGTPQEEITETETIKFRGGERSMGVSTFVNNPNPLMRSGIIFSFANRVWNDTVMPEGDDGVLTAMEVLSIDMRKCDLIVLSACETGLGDIKGSEGVYGLQRAFKMAGVKYIIMSLWQVPDKETVEFMEMFYKKLLKEKDVRRAFNVTQKEMRKKYDPYYWGAFVLVY